MTLQLPVVSLSEWWNGVKVGLDSSPFQQITLPLIDLRSDQRFSEQRIHPRRSAFTSSSPSSSLPIPVVVHLPFMSLVNGERSCELPPRNVEFAILVYPGHDLLQCQCNQGTERCGHCKSSSSDTSDSKRSKTSSDIVEFFLARQSKVTMQSRTPWSVRQVIWDCDETWRQASDLGILVQGSSAAATEHCIPVFYPLPRLWKPDPMMETVVLPLLKQLLKECTFKSPTVNAQNWGVISSPLYEIWDLGSGAGRDVCFLASELKHYLSESQLCHNPCASQSSTWTQPIRIVGIDNHKGSARRCQPLWKHNHVQDITEARCMDLNKVSELHKLLSTNTRSSSSVTTQSTVICMYAVRFLNRKLLEYISSGDRLLKSGTIFAMSHFCKESPGASWPFEHPKVKKVT